MNKTLIIIAMLTMVSTASLNAQGFQKVKFANKKQIDEFFNSKTMVVMDANSLLGYNIVVKNAVDKYWTITQYEVVTSARFNELYKDPKLSFIFLSKVQLERDKEEVHYLYMDIVMGDEVDDISGLPVLLSIPLAYTGVDEETYVDKLPLMIRFAQVHLNNLKTAKNPKTFNNLKTYNKDSKFLKDKTLLVMQDDLSEEVNTLEKIQKVYNGAVKIVDSKTVEKAIEEKTANIAILHQVSPGTEDNRGRSYCQIYGTHDAKLYYFNHQKITKRRPSGMLANDFRLIRWR